MSCELSWAEHSMGLIWQHCKVTGHSLGGASCKISCCLTLDQFTRDCRALVWSWPSFCRWCWRCRRAWWWTPGTSWGWGRSSTSWRGMNTMSDNNWVRWALCTILSKQFNLRHCIIFLRDSENQSPTVCAAKCRPISTGTACLRVRTPGASMTTTARTLRNWTTCPSPSPSTRARSSWWSTWPPSEDTPRSITLWMHWQSVMRTSLSRF